MANDSSAPAQGPIMPPQVSGSTDTTTATKQVQGRPTLAALLEQMQQLEALRGVYGQMMAHAKEAENPPTLYAGADIPVFVDNLSSDEPSVFNKGTLGLASILRHQPDLAKSHVIPLIPSILSLMTTAPDEPRRIAMISLSSTIQASSQEAAEALQAHLDVEGAVSMLKESRPQATKVKTALLHLLETMLRRSRVGQGKKRRSELEQKVVEALRTQLDAFGRESTTLAIDVKGKGRARAHSDGWTAGEVLGFIKTFELILGYEHCITTRFAFLRAGALEFLIRVATTRTHNPYAPSPDPIADPTSPSPSITALRIAVMSCLADLYLRIVKETVAPSDFSHLSFGPDAKFDLQGRILMPLLDIIDDADIDVSDWVIDFMFSRFDDPDGAVEVYLWTHEGSMERVVHKLALSGRKKESDQGGAADRLEVVQSLGVNPFETLGIPGVRVRYGTEQREQDQLVTDSDRKRNDLAPADENEGEKRQPRVEETEQQHIPKDLEGSDRPPIRGEGEEVAEREGTKPGSRPSTEESQQPPVPGEVQQTDEESQLTAEKGSPAHSEDQKVLDARPALALAPAQKTMSDAQQDFLAILTWADTHSKVEILLTRALMQNLDGGVDAFETFWGRRDLEERTREELLQVLSEAVEIVQNAAMSAGVPVPTQAPDDEEASVHRVESSSVAAPLAEEKVGLTTSTGEVDSETKEEGSE